VEEGGGDAVAGERLLLFVTAAAIAHDPLIAALLRRAAIARGGALADVALCAAFSDRLEKPDAGPLVSGSPCRDDTREAGAIDSPDHLVQWLGCSRLPPARCATA
jgi:hypothetical protein